ncbi:MAG: T9SS type A sorting domain-containing protein [Bacteroidota bacterium]|nr:MAG: T9SS type A sorting domain-containing protein [Bacteroidota bacterium]
MTFATGIHDLNETNSLTIYPIPAQQEIVVRVAPLTSQAELQIVDISGRILWTEHIFTEEHTVQIGALANGAYFAHPIFKRRKTHRPFY